MENLVMDMIKGFGYLLIPGFSALSLLVLYHEISKGPGRIKAVVPQPAKIRK
jgi:hypothetical protein